MGQWPSNYKSPGTFSGFGGKVISNNIQEGGFGVTDAIMISGHKTVATVADLYSIPTQILSSNKSNENTSTGWSDDSLGQIWYVQDEKNYYRLINYNNHGSSSGWEKIKILTQKEYEDINKETSSNISNLNQKITSIETNLNNLNTQNIFGLEIWMHSIILIRHKKQTIRHLLLQINIESGIEKFHFLFFYIEHK